MEVQELAVAAQSLSFEQRKELIEMLSVQSAWPNMAEITGGVEKYTNGNSATLQLNEPNNPNLNWLEEHRAEFAGQWVALHEGRLIAHSTDGESLVAPVRQSGIRTPMIVFVEAPNTEIFVGF